jgi:5-amino-6-(5-phosphoribosylamino)uracil reductase/diaminohydroxyphosphoribosylaminopyrimidine deaminase/5-amino-6-(5-phosphoribosylamino)uracil reductase
MPDPGPRAPRPRTTLHYAQSLDGRIGLPGCRTQLSSPEGVVLAHRARTEHDAVLVGRGTLASDDPRLTVRACAGRQPMRVVLSSTLFIPETARVLHDGGGVLVIGAEGRALPERAHELEQAGAAAILVPRTVEGLVSLPHALAALHVRGVRRLLVEGGASVLTGFVRERLADELTIEITPHLLGSPGIGALEWLGDGYAGGVKLDRMAIERAGPSVVVRGQLAYD